MRGTREGRREGRGGEERRGGGRGGEERRVYQVSCVIVHNF